MGSRRKRRRGEWGRHATLEMVLSAAVLIALVATVLIFLFVFHDMPFRAS